MKQIRLAVALALAALALNANAQSARKPYIVQLTDLPVATYDGRVPGLQATRPTAGARLNVNAQDVQNYITFLGKQQAGVVALVPNAPVTYRYKLALNGFATWLTDAEATKLAANAGVKSVSEDIAMPMDTSYTPTFLGLKRVPEGVWNRTDASGRPIKGEGVIIAHLDGGVWPENPSFSDKVDAGGNPIASHLAGTVVYDPLPAGRWAGTCQIGMGFAPSHCNNKLIGARFFNATWKLAVSLGLVTTWTGDYLDSPRDADGHGTHTLSTSGGNENTEAFINGSAFRISGIAPRARVAAYKVCYVPQNAQGVPQQGSCYGGDSVAATEAAIVDGADVINFSVGGSQTSPTGPVDTAFANATLAGVFVSVSAGNSGPGNTVAHINPWVTTVGNSTHDRFTQATVTFGNGDTATGTSFQTSGLSSRGLIYSRNAGFDGAPVTTNQALCFGATDSVPALLDPVKVAGKILICERGSNVLVNKVANAQAAGATGVIILNTPTSANTAPTISAVLPTVHLTAAYYPAVTAYAATANPTASFGPGVQVPGVVAPVMADTSSRGPNRFDPNLLKPDITAPGTDIIAAYTNDSITPAQRQQIIDGTLVPGPGADMISGTSMASPHVAGAAALLRQANPTWSPLAIKSALMTSTLQNVLLANGTPDLNRWGFGAGHLNPNDALSTKVIYDMTGNDIINYYNGAIGGRDLNTASLTHANVIGVGSLTRKLTNKGTSSVTYNATSALAGYTVTVSPPSLTIPAGGSATYTVTMKRNGAPLESWVFGNLTWVPASGGANLFSPLSAKASEFVAPGLVTDTRAIGTKVFTVGSGYDGALVTTPIGLVPATRNTGAVSVNERQCFPFTVAAGARQVRVQLFNSDVQGGASSDLDLVVTRSGATVGSSGNTDSNELITLTNPTASANYQACVDGYAPVGGRATFTVSTWVVGPAVGTQTLRAAGATRVTTGGTASVAASWNVPAGVRYLGVIDFRSVAAGPIIGSTTIFVDNAPGAPAAVAQKIEAAVREKPAI